jgi:hypothetical protein
MGLSMFQAAFLGGLFTGVVASLPVIGLGNCCCCLFNLLGGGIAAYLDQQNTGRTTTVGRGTMVGAASGVIGAFVFLFSQMAMGALLGSPEAGLAALLQSGADLPPEVRDAMETLSTSGPGVFYAVGFVASLCVGTVFSAIGGALAGAFFRNDVPPALGGPIQPPLSQ